MRERLQNYLSKKALAISIAALIFLLLLGYAYSMEAKKSSALELKIGELEEALTLTESNLNRTKEEKASLGRAFNNEKDRNDALAEEVEGISDTVGDLTKLNELEEELLQKYSKVYFLNEHYAPPRLREIDEEYTVNGEEFVDSRAWKYLEDLLEDAADEGIELQIVSGYRSFAEQSSLKSSYSVIYGSGANQFSADQGYSEHQLGTTVDFTTKALGASFTNLGNTEAYQWLVDNAYRRGFILSYPQGNAYYQYEPWHWRFVGRDLARYINREELTFYSLDQRKIDEFLLEIFD